MKTLRLLLTVLSLLGCADGGTSSEQIDISYGNNHSPVGAKLVHGTLFVAHVVVNESLDYDMLIDTGSSRTCVPSQRFGNAGGQINIASLCFENDVCVSNFMALNPLIQASHNPRLDTSMVSLEWIY